ncbi:MAG: hypothetical protein ACFCD0_30435 [Gemmataceae bacterium]
MPKSDVVTAVKISVWTNKTSYPLTIANVAVVLDGMTPVHAPKQYRYASYASWHDCELETRYGKFQISFYLNGLAVVQFPNDTIGLATFDRPTK